MRSILLLMSLLAPFATSALAQPEGDYWLATMRLASKVTAPQHVFDAAGQAGHASFSAERVRLNGAECRSFTFDPLPHHPTDLDDPMLSDMAIGIDRGSVKSWLLTCEGQQVASIVEIDKRTLLFVSPEGALHYVLETPLERKEIERLQGALIKRGFLEGPASEVVDEATIEALGYYTEDLGAAYRFARPVLTEALLSDLGVVD